MPWVVVLPVQRAERAKTRLGRTDPLPRPQLARAIALDTLASVRACDAVVVRLVVTSDAVVTAEAAGAGDRVLADPGGGLGAAVEAGLHAAAEQWPQLPVAVLLADLPALRPTDLATALDAAAVHERAVLPDHEGSGTVLLTARAGARARPAFGPGSAAALAALGAVTLQLDLPSLRQDVDTAADLAHARDLGLGPRTRALLATGGPGGHDGDG